MPEQVRYGHWYEREDIEALAAHVIDDWDAWLEVNDLTDDYASGKLYMPPHLEDKLPADFHELMRKRKRGY